MRRNDLGSVRNNEDKGGRVRVSVVGSGPGIHYPSHGTRYTQINHRPKVNLTDGVTGNH